MPELTLVSLGDVRDPHHPHGQLWLRVGGPPDAREWWVRYVTEPDDRVEFPIWSIPQTYEHWWVLYLARARAVLRGHVPLAAIPSAKDLGALSAIPPVPGVTLRRVVLSTEPDEEFAGWEFATIFVRPADAITAAWQRERDTNDDMAGNAGDNAVILAASDHPDVRRLYITHALHGTEREEGRRPDPDV